MATSKRKKRATISGMSIGVRPDTHAEALRLRLMLSMVEGDVVTLDTVVAAALAVLKKKIQSELAGRKVTRHLAR